MESAQDYRRDLRDELVRRTASNTGYSLRAFARDLKVSPAFMSQVLNGKRSLSEERAWDWSKRLGWIGPRQQIFVSRVRLEGAKDTNLREGLELSLLRLSDKKKEPVKRIGHDVVDAFSTWEHPALCELVEMSGFRSDPDWIAEKLGLTRLQTDFAIDRLVRLGLLKWEGSRLVKSEPNFSTQDDIPSSAIRALHMQGLKKAARSLEKDPTEEREFGTVYVLADPSRIGEFKRMIRDFQEESWKTMQKTAPEALYQISVQLVRVDQETKKI